LKFLGRNDFQVKVRGFRIELGEIEARLAAHAGVREAVVVAREDNPGDKRLVAYYTCLNTSEQGEDPVGAEVLRTHLAASLPEYMVPAAYVRLEALPLTPNGKLDRKALPAPEADAYAARGYEAPEGEIEATLAGIWADVLGVERIGRHDNFFQLGGHSLLTLKVVSSLKYLGIDISVADVFMHPTIGSLAAQISRQGRRDYMAIPLRAGRGESPLFLVHEGAGELIYALVLKPHIDANVPIYGLPCKPLAETQFRTIEAMAARMVRMIRAVQPVGPYRIAGWSFGGTLAYEIATQLIGEDQVVEFLGLFDTNYEYRASAFCEHALDDKSWLLSRLQFGSSVNENLQAAIEEVKRLALTMDFVNLARKCQEMSLLPGYLTAVSSEEIPEYLRRERMLTLANLQYIAQPIPIPIHLFAAQGEETADPLRRWGAVLPEEQVRVIRVPGTHQSMMMAPNIEPLGKALSRAIRDANECRSLLERSYSPLGVLHTGRRHNTPLFCVPGAGDNVFSFAELADSLDKELPVYGLQQRGLDGALVPHSTVSAAAESYLQALNEIQPEGPVHLFGHSFGGWVVFEMAQRLRAAGRAIASLTILDSEVPDNDDALVREYNRTEAVMKLIETLEQVLGYPLEIGASNLDSCDDAAQRQLLHERLVRVGRMPRRSKPDVLRGPLRTFAASLRTHYRPDKVYPEPVRLVLVDDPKLDDEANRLQRERTIKGWRRWAPNLFFLYGPGNHMTALKRPHVHALATWLSMDLQSNGVERAGQMEYC
jgi:thioesterase domain-containing protein